MERITNIVKPSIVPAGIILGLFIVINSVCGNNQTAKVYTTIGFSPVILYLGKFIQKTVVKELKKGDI